MANKIGDIYAGVVADHCRSGKCDDCQKTRKGLGQYHNTRYCEPWYCEQCARKWMKALGTLPQHLQFNYQSIIKSTGLTYR